MATSPAKINAAAPALVLAPHLRYPTRNGADIYADRIACALSRMPAHVDVLAEGSFVSYENGKEVRREIFPNAYRSRNLAALRTLFKRSHYYREKFVTAAYAKRARELIDSGVYRSVVCSYIATASLLNLEKVGIPVFALTHNDEFRWFENMSGSASMPGAGSVALQSIRWLDNYLRENATRLNLIHVTAEDQTGYEQRYPDSQHAIAPVGVDLPKVTASPLSSNIENVTLLFVGALGVKMNFDALDHFARNFLPTLSGALGGQLKVVVAGSSPTAAVRTLTGSRGWQVWEDIPEHVLEDLYLSATFAILPFPYATGAKLKLLKALSYGVPVLSTVVLSAQVDMIQSPSFMSDEPAAWLEHIRTVRRFGVTVEERGKLRGIAAEHSWSRSASILTGIEITES